MQLPCRAGKSVYPGGGRTDPLIARGRGLRLGMNSGRPPYAKIVVHGEGMGVPTSEMVRQRALELARIDGRTGYDDRDWQRARQELHGGQPSSWDADEDRMSESISGGDMTATDSGHHVENLRGGDDNMTEELVAEGIDEAVHDQMLEASRQEAEEEGGAENG